MIALAAAATTMFSFGDLPTGTSFEGLTTGDKTVADIVDNDDAGTPDGTLYWFSTADDTEALGVVTNEAPYTGTMRPEAYTGASNANYLTLDTSTPLYRTINGAASSIGDFEGTEIGDGLYLDTLVKFTAADSTNDLQLAEGDKIAISYVVEDMDDDGDGVYLTNFVVRAGYVNGSGIDQKNYVMDAIDDFDITVWHRLTVRAISDVGSSAAPVGFVVYVDGEALAYSTDVAAGDAAYVESLNAAVAQNLYNSGKHALLPSTVNSGSAKTTLSAVAFKGNGSIDDISFTQTKPEFIDEGMAVTIAWDAGVETVKIGDDEAFATAGLDYTATNITVDAGVTSLAVIANYAEGKEAGKWDVPEGTTFANDTWTGFSSGATLTIKSMTPLFKVGDKKYDDFTAALEEAVAAAEQSGSPATIQLLGNIDGAISFTEGNIVLDLNGKTIQGGAEDEYSLANQGANLVITDSATGGKVAGANTGSLLVYGDAAITTIQAGIYAGNISVIGDTLERKDILTITGGSFYDVDYDPEDPAFYLADTVDTAVYTIAGPTFDSDDNVYIFTVSSGVTPEPTTYELTIPEVTGATATVTDADEQEISDRTKIAAGTVVTVTWAATEGYKITAGASEEITMDANKTANEPTVALIKYATLTITQVENCTIVVSNATEEVASGAQFDVDDETQLTVYRTPANGYKLSEGYAATETITMNANVTVTAVVEKDSEEPEYPSYIPEDAAVKAKYDTWATTYGADTGSAYEDAFLLNIAPDAVDQTLEPASITMEGGKVVISANQTLTAVNGKVYVKVATTLAGLATAGWTEATLDEGKVQVTPGSSETAGFYKIKVDF